ncbi:unnamed protein product [Didymodactylos carnosus]|nr:unnamed protein product [Didymodactylos carnosus]
MKCNYSIPIIGGTYIESVSTVDNYRNDKITTPEINYGGPSVCDNPTQPKIVQSGFKPFRSKDKNETFSTIQTVADMDHDALDEADHDCEDHIILFGGKYVKNITTPLESNIILGDAINLGSSGLTFDHNRTHIIKIELIEVLHIQYVEIPRPSNVNRFAINLRDPKGYVTTFISKQAEAPNIPSFPEFDTIVIYIYVLSTVNSEPSSYITLNIFM